MIDPIAQADPLEERPRLCAALMLGEVLRPIEGRHHHVFERRHPRQEVEVLKDEADLSAPQPGSLRFAKMRDVVVIEPLPAGGRTIEEAQEVDECRFSRTRDTHQGDHLASRDRERDAPEHGHVDRPARVDFVNILQPDESLQSLDRRGTGRDRRSAFLELGTNPAGSLTLTFLWRFAPGMRQD